MSKLTAIRKQIAALEAEAARIGQVEIKAAIAYFSPSWTAFQADRGRCFSGIVDGISV
jgi:hypothetical protein